MIFNMTGGGGSSAALNFKVVGGTTQPTSPSENMIWVNTDTEIASWEFSSTNPYIEYRDADVIDGLTFGEGYFTSSGLINGQTASYPELYTNEYIPVKYGTSYTWEYSVSASKSMWLAIIEYTGSYTFKEKLVPLSSVTGTYQTGTYTPSADTVTAVRLNWRTFSNTTSEVKFIVPDVECTIGEPEGFVWISTGASSPVEFNALKKNNITVYPISAKQYVDGAWVDKTAKTYQNGTWADWITYLYNKGNQYTALTGGWTSYGNYADIKFNSDHIYLTIKSGYNEQWGMAHTVNKIDVTNINTLCFYIDERTSADIAESSNVNSKYSTVGISVSPDVRTNGWTAYARIPTGTTQTLFEVDVSAYSGTYYVCILNAVNATNTTYMKCSSVYGM